MSFSILFFFVILLGVPTHQASELATQTCDKTTVKELCNSVLGTSTATDMLNLVKDVLQATSVQGGEVSTRIATLLPDKTSPVMKALLDCSELYDKAMDKLKFSTAALDAKDYVNVDAGISTAMTHGQTCEDGFKGASPLTEVNTKFTQLCGLTLSIIKTIQQTA